jgi:hypothetical protein
MYSDMLTILKALHYSGDHKDFMLNKFCTANVKQHNLHAALAKFKVGALSNEMKIHYFQNQKGIKDRSLSIVKGNIMTARATNPKKKG